MGSLCAEYIFLSNIQNNRYSPHLKHIPPSASLALISLTEEEDAAMAFFGSISVRTKVRWVLGYMVCTEFWGVALDTIFTQFVARREKVIDSIQGNDCVVL